jgi:uncharacterized phage infection (PIP) family protein YhgE
MSVLIPGVGRVNKQRFSVQRGGAHYYATGTGIGGVFRGVAKFLLPLLRYHGTKLLRGGMKAAAEVLNEKSDNFDRPLKEITKNVLKKYRGIPQSGEGIRQKKIGVKQLNEIISGYVLNRNSRKNSSTKPKQYKNKKKTVKRLTKSINKKKIKKKKEKKKLGKKSKRNKKTDFDIFE